MIVQPEILCILLYLVNLLILNALIKFYSRDFNHLRVTWSVPICNNTEL